MRRMATYRSDWWAVGVLLYVLTAKRFPFDAGPTKVKAARQQDIVSRINYSEPDYTGAPFEDLGMILLTTVIRGLLVKQSKNRWDGDNVFASEWNKAFLDSDITRCKAT
jgi:serine/threonine protein kinase